jgi:hypothetical protein
VPKKSTTGVRTVLDALSVVVVLDPAVRSALMLSFVSLEFRPLFMFSAEPHATTHASAEVKIVRRI